MNHYSVQLCIAKGQWKQLLTEERFYSVMEARRAGESQLISGPEYRLIRILRNGDPLEKNDGAGWVAL